MRYFCYFLISRRDGENNGFLAGVPLLPPPSRVVSRPNSLPLPLPFRTPATQATRYLDPVCNPASDTIDCYQLLMVLALQYY